jgi:diguanylate cyclase (GGDEF)-like protein/PAS domain S-box-containing protein
MKANRRKHSIEIEKSYRSLIENIKDYAIFILDKKGNIMSWDQGARKQLGYKRTDVMGKSFSMFFTPKDRRSGIPKKDMLLALREGRALDERQYVRKDGSTYWSSGVLTSTIDRSGTHQGFSKIMRDVTEQKDLQKIIMHRSTHDYLTSLPNRRYFEQSLVKAIHAATKKSITAIMFLDFNNFKMINDTYGHKHGDLALIEIATRLTNNIRASDMAARLGGDEFVILLRGFGNSPQIERFARKILRLFRKEIVVAKKKFITSVSIGIAIHPTHGKKAAHLLRNSDIALYEAKKEGGNRYVIYSA